MTDSPLPAPKAFISYVHNEVTAWALALATRLRTQSGVDVTLDQWDAAPGAQLPLFMERAIRENAFVLILCTPRYRERANARLGGVGYETDIMTGEVLLLRARRKFIPLLREGEPPTALPSWLMGSYFLDFRGDPYPEKSYTELIQTVHSLRPGPPPIGGGPTV
jgi:hypothetical protein